MKIFKCKKCGNMVELIEEKGGTLVCCGEAMELVEASTVDAAREKHVPYTEIEDDVVYVKIGEVDHPMTDEHYIEWVAAVFNDSVLKYNFKPGEVPEAVFDYEEGMEIYAYCNLHGLWKKEL